MSKAAAIAAQLVDIRNVGTHKVVKLTIHVPAEQAGLVFDAFGWPTGVDPVPVALARLRDSGETERVPSPLREARGQSCDGSASASRHKQSWHDMSPAQQAGLLCGDPLFQQFLFEMHGCPEKTSSDAAEHVRIHCGVASRREINNEDRSGRLWRDLVADFRVFERALV